MKLNFNFDGKTFLSKWWKIVRDNFTAIQTDHNTLSDKLDTEITQRTNADVGLAKQITAEKTARESAESSLSSRINNEVTIRQAADNELQRNLDSEITERQTADSKKADKTELYGTDETVRHTITHTLTTSDFVININASYDTGTVKIPAETVHSKILLDGSPMPATEVIGTFDCGKSEEDHGDKYVAIAYSPNTGKLDIDVVDIDCSPTDADAIAEINIQYQRAEITKMYHLSHIFYGISSLNDLKTNNKNSFLAAVNEIFATAKTASDTANTAQKNANDAVVDTSTLRGEFDEHERSQNNPHNVTAEQVGLGDVPNVTTNNQKPTFTEATNRSNIVSGETISVLFGKIKKFFTDLKTVAFTGSYTDLSNKPTSMQNPNSLTLTMNGSSSSYNGASSASKAWYAPTSAGTAGYKLISNGSGAPIWQQPPYAVCSTATTTAAKTVSITNFKLITGARVLVKFTYAHKSSGSATLNISNTGAKTICIEKPEAPYGNSSFSITSITSQNSWQAGDILDLVYNGTYWCVIGSTGFLQSGRYSSNVIIGTEDNNLGAYCDYICDGSNDQTIIQQAINDLPSTGGKIVLLEGTYNISEELTLPYPITFEGTVNTSLYVFSQGLLRYDTNNISASNIATFKDININFCSTDNDTEGYVGAFENFELTFENCTISKRTTYQSIWRLFFNCKVKMINTDVDITMPNSGWGATLDCFWVFGESTVELLNTHIWFTGKNPVNNGVFYDSKGTMTGGWITNTKKDTNNHGVSYILSNSPITFLGTQIRCREFAQDWNTSSSDGYRPSLDSCKIEILDGGSFSCSHAGHIDLVLSSSSKTSIIPAYALISNSKLFITFDHQLVLRDYAFLEACYINRVNYKGSGSSSSAKTTDTSTVTSMAKPIFIDTEGTNNE